MPTMRGAEIIVEHLIAERVPYLFGLCGHGIIGFLDAVYDRQDKIKPISVHHEQAAGHMADAFWRVTHRLVATFTSCGPGSTNLPVALGSAMMDSSAMLAITGNVPTSQFNRGAFQETYRYHQADFPSVLRPYVKRSYQATRPEQLPLMMRQAFQLALGGRPGPVQVDVPLDIFVESTEVAPGAIRSGAEQVVSRPAGDEGRVRAAVQMLVSAERPMIMAGNGAMLSEAGKELLALVERLGIPLVTTPLGAGIIDGMHPLELGRTGRTGTYHANEATRHADVILTLGSRFDDRVSSGWIPGFTFNFPETRLIQVDLDPSELGRNYPMDIGIVGDVKAVLIQMLRLLDEQGIFRPQGVPQWLAAVAGWRKVWEDGTGPAKAAGGSTIRPERVLGALEKLLPADGLLLSDVGVHHNWIVQHWRPRREQSLLQSWGFGSMGFAVCGALGAKLAAPDRPVLAVVGDGGFLMTPHIVATAVEYDIPVVWLVWNNYGYVSIRDLQVGAFGPRELVTSFNKERTGELFSVDFAAMARSMGAEGARVDRPQDLEGAIETALKSGRPYVLDVRVDRDIRPLATGGWHLPPLPPTRPTFPVG